MPSSLEHLDPVMHSIAARTLEALAQLPDDAARLGSQLLVKLSPPQWQLEWWLPRWLGNSYGLPPDVTETLILANVTGLLFICLQDQLADEGVPPADLSAAICLGTALHGQWLRCYHPHFEATAPFWGAFDDIMAQWMHALAVSNRMPDVDFATLLQCEPGPLAHRAAPLKVCCAAAAYLARRADLLPPLAATLDHLHVAAVLLDHAHDWQDDLQAGRYNAFVHFASPAPQTLERRELNRQRVYEELFLGQAGHAYFAHALHHLEQAHNQAAAVACPPLVAYLNWYYTIALSVRDRLAASARHAVEAAVQLVFGNTSETMHPGGEQWRPRQNSNE